MRLMVITFHRLITTTNPDKFLKTRSHTMVEDLSSKINKDPIPPRDLTTREETVDEDSNVITIETADAITMLILENLTGSNISAGMADNVEEETVVFHILMKRTIAMLQTT